MGRILQDAVDCAGAAHRRGHGWCWTRWQQNVNDLKSMIDLVTDKSPEKQKYGIAMFEYLAKNGKVPMEFLAAQID
ncbi:MAG TPA: hypothetical protein VIG38_12010 [Hyphomicrobium sp.]